MELKYLQILRKILRYKAGHKPDIEGNIEDQ